MKYFVWSELLNSYPSFFPIYLPMIFYFEVQLGYKDFQVFILLKNLASALIDTEIIDKKLVDDLRISQLEKVAKPTSLFISFPLRLVFKYDREWRKIHHFSHSIG